MSDDRKTNKQSTGTVPKPKHRNNNISSSFSEQEKSSSLTNNLVASHWLYPSDLSNLLRNSGRNQQNNYQNMDTSVEEPIQNGSVNFNHPGMSNGSITPNSTSSSCKRNSSLKCDNVKFPDRKKIEEKLHQIREYLKVTNSLMTSMKNTNDQANEQAEKESLEKMINDLQDSERKLLDILEQLNCNDEEAQSTQITEIESDNISEQGASYLRSGDGDLNFVNHTQEGETKELRDAMGLQKAENKHKDGRHNDTKLSSLQCGNDLNDFTKYDSEIQELEDRTNRLAAPPFVSQKMQDNILARVESLHNQIISMHNANDEREHLIETLDNRDAELRQQHSELQNKLQELQKKKMQVDHLVSQLHSFGDVEEDDIGGQVKKIVGMKDQLKELKDMLELVKNAEAGSYDACMSAESFLEKDNQKPKMQPQVQTNILRNDSYLQANDNLPKEVNKHSTEHRCKEVKAGYTSVDKKLSLQRELEAKKKELEEIMGKHKAGTSNLNHDVGADVKSEFSSTSNAINEAWVPLLPAQCHHADSDRFSSDDYQEEDINNYSEMQDNHNVLNLPGFPHLKSKGPRSATCDEYIQLSEFDRSHRVSSCTPERNIRSNSTPRCPKETHMSNPEHESKIQIQKQLQLIKSVCDSMLEQQSTSSQQTNVQLRNNLTPSPLCFEPRRINSPNPRSVNALNVINPSADAARCNAHGTANPDVCSYHNWLATNTIQTQSFMLNTLNQCCQMLWLQQRELVNLKNTVALLQERIDSNPYGGQPDQIAPTFQSHQDRRPSTQYRPIPNRKVNHVSGAFSLPNLNQYDRPPSNLDLNYINQNNVQNCRLLDPCLNNVSHLNATQGVEQANNILQHSVNSNINHSLPNHLWNGQALNNQVAPGNRTNNYWDNFRR